MENRFGLHNVIRHSRVVVASIIAFYYSGIYTDNAAVEKL